MMSQKGQVINILMEKIHLAKHSKALKSYYWGNFWENIIIQPLDK